ncbi:E3 ubiquitin-protein ligase RNF183 [Paramormyrops kingsleyae]|uniref:Ring finger protein 183 n=1 Tax=Paramormyrops kingsleyae TaxID=1676925 RepID=A0A3B3SQP4_9TELE|nr:probable E3 ubiquitin-protein ligase RNF183 [Paramormyrops kingsleyae]XP_023658390.1 probable E3 ubiquitin-protein ligase RNF183 [Paramormyrops kingsleyae]
MNDAKGSENIRGGHSSKMTQQNKIPQAERKNRSMRRSRSSDAGLGERNGRKMEQDRAERRQRGRSEERRGSRVSGNRGRDDGTEDTECIVCFCPYDNVFKAPKILACGHTFCLECLARINVSSVELKSLACPICRGLTELPHGRDLPQLDNNKDIFSRLPPEMQRALSVRFQRSKGKLVLKKPPAFNKPAASSLALPNFKKEKKEHQAQGNLQFGNLEAGLDQATTVDVGRPPSRVRTRLRQIMRSNHCYYAVVAAIIIITVTLMLVGILAFVVMPLAPMGNQINTGNTSNEHRP